MEYSDWWTFGEIIGVAGFICLMFWAIRWLIGCLRFHFKRPKYEPDNDDDIDKLGMC